MPVLKDCNIWYGGYDLTSAANQVDIDTSFADVDVTVFGNGGVHQRIAGLEDSKISVMTFLDPALSEPAITSKRGGTTDLFTAVAFPTSGTVTVGDQCYAVRAQLDSFKEPMKVGDAARIEASLMTSQVEGLLQGQVLAPKTTVSATVSSAGATLGAVSAGQIAYLGAHIFAVTGDRTVTIRLQSSPNSTFTAGTVTNRVALSTVSAAGSQFGSSTTATTDPYWRSQITLGGTTGSVTYATFAAIQ